MYSTISTHGFSQPPVINIFINKINILWSNVQTTYHVCGMPVKLRYLYVIILCYIGGTYVFRHLALCTPRRRYKICLHIRDSSYQLPTYSVLCFILLKQKAKGHTLFRSKLYFFIYTYCRFTFKPNQNK